MFPFVLLLFALVSFPFIRATDKKYKTFDEASEELDKDCSLCGYTKYTTATLIINGEEVTPVYKYPWIVPIMGDFSSFFDCGGVIISRTFVLTAAHCISHYMDVGIMETSPTSPDEKIEVAEVFEHPNYTNPVDGDDIALLRVKEPFRCNKFARPICLPREKMSEINDTVLIAGHGKIYHDPTKEYVKVLREGKVKHIDSEYCQMTTSREISLEKIFCTIGLLNQTSCKGDSGSPVFQCFDGIYYSLGVTSIHTNATFCPIDAPVTFASTLGYMDWIQSIVKDLPSPPAIRIIMT